MKITKKMIQHWWGKGIIVKGRFLVYYSLISLLMMLRVFLSTFENQLLGWTLFLAGMFCLIIITYVDFKWIYDAQNSIGWNKTPQAKDLSSRVIRIEEKIDKLLEDKK